MTKNINVLYHRAIFIPKCEICYLPPVCSYPDTAVCENVEAVQIVRTADISSTVLDHLLFYKSASYLLRTNSRFLL